MKDTERKLAKWSKIDEITAEPAKDPEKSHKQSSSGVSSMNIRPTAEDVIANSERTDLRIEHKQRTRAWVSYSVIVSGSVNPHDHQNIVVLLECVYSHAGPLPRT